MGYEGIGWILLGIVAVMGLFWLLLQQQQKQPPIEHFAAPIRGQFVRNNEQVLFAVDLEVANTAVAIERGLMYRTHLAPNAGMLFVFADEKERAFWMRNTLIPLDMIFVNSAGRITNIVHSVPPQNDTLRRSTEPVQYVVELPGGTAERHELNAGDRFTWNY